MEPSNCLQLATKLTSRLMKIIDNNNDTLNNRISFCILCFGADQQLHGNAYDIYGNAPVPIVVCKLV